jgi:hypothetical protein
VTHRVARILNLFTLSNEASENIGALLFRLEGDALALLQASGAILKNGSTC